MLPKVPHIAFNVDTGYVLAVIGIYLGQEDINLL